MAGGGHVQPGQRCRFCVPTLPAPNCRAEAGAPGERAGSTSAGVCPAPTLQGAACHASSSCWAGRPRPEAEETAGLRPAALSPPPAGLQGRAGVCQRAWVQRRVCDNLMSNLRDT